MSKKEKQKFIDDGHTIYNMDIDGMPHRVKKSSIGLTKKERNAMIRAAFAHYIPIFLGVIICFLLTMFIIYLWLN